jgi:ABC-type multidrug transport system fused ATPase/permease subunit
LTMFLAGYEIVFRYSWKLTLVMMATFPLMAGCAVWLSLTVSAGSTKTQAAYSKAGAIAQQVIAGVKTVVSFGRENSEVERYNIHLDEAEKFGIRKGWEQGKSQLFFFENGLFSQRDYPSQGLGMGCLIGCMYLSYSLGLWYGAILIFDNELQADKVISTFFSVLIGAFALGQSGPGFTALSNARGAAVQIYKIINRESAINHEDPSGQPFTQIKQTIEFKDVKFAYPKRPDVSILKNFNLSIKAGQTVALVGSSGSGKSTIVKLMERFYNPLSGSISIDGQDITSFNVKSLRQAIAIVSQEPVLFDLTIRDNILLGLKSDDFSSAYTDQQKDDMVVEACKTANIWEFVRSLPQGINTSVGEAGSMMSGGQKQR